MTDIVTADAVIDAPIAQQEAEESAIDESTDSTDEVASAEPEHTEQDKVQKRIDKAIYEKHQARREAEQARQEIADLRARIESGQPQAATDDISALVKQEAARLKAEETFNESCNKTYEAGVKEFGASFDAAMKNLALVGMSRDFLELVSEADHGAKILAHLGKDLDEAERISTLPPLKMARELTKLDIKLGSTKTKAVSKAPPPITPVSGKSGGNKSPAEMTDAEYAKWRRG